MAEAHCGEITVENRIKFASQLEMIYPQRSFIFSINDGAFLGVLLIISVIGQLSLSFALIQSKTNGRNIKSTMQNKGEKVSVVTIKTD